MSGLVVGREVEHRCPFVQRDPLVPIRIEEYKERERKRKLDIIERSFVESAGASQGKAQEKEAAIEKAARRRAAQLELRAEESRLKFEAKRETIERQRRVKEHEQFLRMLQQEEKNQRLDGESARPLVPCAFLILLGSFAL